MTSKSTFFWTDLQQAQERLSGTVVLYDNFPVHISQIEGADDGVPRAYINQCGAEGRGETPLRKRLDSPKFSRFRELPKLGWANSLGEKPYAVLLSRNIRNSRSHGLSNNNVTLLVSSFDPSNHLFSLTPVGITFDRFMYNDGFVALHKGQYPSLEKTLMSIGERRSIAFSPIFAVLRDRNGLRWLYRKEEPIGVFTGVDSLNLFTSKSYLREEIMDDPLFTINTIREF